MQVFYTLADFEKYRNKPGNELSPIGLVPTMGALHEGHLSLIRKAGECKTVMVSIFVNPTQFNDPSDLKKYPRNTEKDLAILESCKPDVVFIPSVNDIYPEPDKRIFDFGKLDKVMEGAHRPGHFNGVAQVVSRLFDIFKPDRAYFGQKDFQQLAIIRDLVKQLNYQIDVISCPIIRDKEGLALSSRNELLSKEEKIHASGIHKILLQARDQSKKMDPEELKSHALNKLKSIPGAQPEYFEIVDTKSLEKIESRDHKGEIIACTAVKINRVRLIDNLIFD